MTACTCAARPAYEGATPVHTARCAVTAAVHPNRYQPARGDRFEHARYIIGSPKAGTARPDVCTVTRVASGVVYYKTETGMRMSQARDRFADSVKRWVER